MNLRRVGVTLFVLFLIVGLAGCADTTADEDQIESDGENGGDAEIDETDSESDDTENESETVPGADDSDAGPDNITEQDDDNDEIPDSEENDDFEVSEGEIETTEEEEDSIAESVTTVNDFERELSNEGIEVHTTDFDEDGSLAVSLFEYHSNENIEGGETHELRLIAKAYAGLIDSGYQTVELEVAQFDPDSPVDYPWASYRIETVWAEDYNDGSISEEEYIELIIEEYQVIEDL